MISQVIQHYLQDSEDERVSRDMDLAKAFYQIKLDEMSAITERLVLDPWVQQNFASAAAGDPEAIEILEQLIANKITILALGGSHLITIMDSQGRTIVGQTLDSYGRMAPVSGGIVFGDLPIVASTLTLGRSEAATEIIPQNFLMPIGFEQQAEIPLIDTPKAAPTPFDPREGSAGLAVTGTSPLFDENGKIIGAVLAVYLLNNDFTLVDRIKQVAGIDTVTLFFGDLRVSTNVLNEDGSRAVGTRVSEIVNQTVLQKGEDYVGEAFVVNDWYITRYTPLHDHQGKVVGSLYVGALRSTFDRLVNTYYNRVALIALVCLFFAALIAIPVSRAISRPIQQLAEANLNLADGNMDVRVEPFGQGELALLGQSFNQMVDTLQKTQQELIHKEKLASMGQLAAGVAHEINNPLGTILLFSESLLKETPPESTVGDDLRMIINETNRCKRIVSDLLNFSRQQEILTQKVDIHALLDQVVDLVTLQRNYKNVRLSRNFGNDLPEIHADPDQLQQVFINLLNNAAEAFDDGGEITLTTRRTDQQWIEIKVSDNGRGIPSKNLNKLFTPFFTTKPQGKGTGLGLSIVYGIINMHRGQIFVESEPNIGTTFSVVLPVNIMKTDRE